MRQLVVETERSWPLLGQLIYGCKKAEKGSLRHQRSLYIDEDLRINDVLTENNLRIVRPVLGFPPKYYDTVLGSMVNNHLKKGDPFEEGFNQLT